MNVGLEIFVDYDQAEVKSFEIYENLGAGPFPQVLRTNGQDTKFRPRYKSISNTLGIQLMSRS